MLIRFNKFIASFIIGAMLSLINNMANANISFCPHDYVNGYSTGWLAINGEIQEPTYFIGAQIVDDGNVNYQRHLLCSYVIMDESAEKTHVFTVIKLKSDHSEAFVPHPFTDSHWLRQTCGGNESVKLAPGYCMVADEKSHH